MTNTPTYPDGPVVIIGAGQAGVQTAASLRQGGFDGAIYLYGDEAVLPYQRPPLSKAYLKGESDAERLALKPADWYEAQNITLKAGDPVVSISRKDHTVTTQSGDEQKYAHLVFATGSRCRPLPGQDGQADNVLVMRTLADADQLKTYAAPDKKLLIIGGGYIGLEAAAAARSLGAHVTLIELADNVLARVAGQDISKFYEARHMSEGVELITKQSVTALNIEDNEVKSVTLSGGQTIDCDAVLVGIGIIPNSELAQDMGVTCDNGILVDAQCQTNLPNIYAVGDCTVRPVQAYGYTMRLESVHNAIEQGKICAASILGAPPARLDCPWFWSDQYDLKIQTAGVLRGYDQTIMRGDPKSGSFSVFYFKDKRLIASDSVNQPQDFIVTKKLILGGINITPEEIANPDITMRDFLKLTKT